VSFTLHGAGAGGGIAIGRAHLISSARREVARYEIAPEHVELEVMSF
jgi:phosphotransferase system enzyme I (PtsI)